MANVSQAAPYRHFDSKQALLVALAEEGFRKMAAQMAEMIAAHPDDPMARLSALGHAYVRFATENPAHFRIMFGPAVADKKSCVELNEAADLSFSFLLQAVGDCIDAGIFPEEAHRDITLVAWSSVHGLSSLIVDGQFADMPEEELKALPHVLTDSLMRATQGPPV
jgi:AcrR family transcriptional regulator